MRILNTDADKPISKPSKEKEITNPCLHQRRRALTQPERHGSKKNAARDSKELLEGNIGTSKKRIGPSMGPSKGGVLIAGKRLLGLNRKQHTKIERKPSGHSDDVFLFEARWWRQKNKLRGRLRFVDWEKGSYTLKKQVGRAGSACEQGDPLFFTSRKEGLTSKTRHRGRSYLPDGE